MASEPQNVQPHVFASNWFTKFQSKAGIADQDLCNAVQRLVVGAIDADLGGGVFKQRVARTGLGKSGGFRTIVLFRVEHLAFFVYGFAKNEQANITRSDLLRFRQLAKDVFRYDDQKLRSLIEAGEIRQICENPKDVRQ